MVKELKQLPLDCDIPVMVHDVYVKSILDVCRILSIYKFEILQSGLDAVSGLIQAIFNRIFIAIIIRFTKYSIFPL